MRRRTWLPWTIVFLLFELPAHPCGPDFPTAIFVMTEHPGGDYAAFAKGHIGVPQKDYRTRDLVLIYNYLTDRPPSPAEQAQAVAVQHHYMDSWSDNEQARKSAPPTGYDAWEKARPVFGTPPPIINSIDTGNWESTTNCLDPAFTTAASTLSARMKA